MSNGANFDENASRRTNATPYTSRHPVPTVQGSQDTQEEREAATENTLPEIEDNNREEGKLHDLLESAKSHLHINGSEAKGPNHKPYFSSNHNVERPASKDSSYEEGRRKNRQGGDCESSGGQQQGQDFTAELDPRKKRKNMKHMKRDHAPREVTDPVTHLPVMIHDSTSTELKSAPENVPRGDSSSGGSSLHLERETEQEQAEHRGMEKLFPPPNFEAMREELIGVYNHALMIGLGAVLAISLLLLTGSHLIISLGVIDRSNDSSRSWLYVTSSSVILLTSGLVVGSGVIWGLRDWLKNKINAAWNDGVWHAAKEEEQNSSDSPMPESTEWLNSILASVWSLVNPDLFTSLADTLEDVMQASLPKMVRMISVEDLGQGSEAIRILGIRWLPRGAAAKDISVNGKIKDYDKKGETDRKVPGEGEVDDGNQSGKQDGKQSREDKNQQDGDNENVAEGLEAEEGDFVNVEVAFSYRASSSGKMIKDKVNNAHLFLAFYLPGKIRFRKFSQSSLTRSFDESLYWFLPAVWVELRGLVGTMRMRLQLCPDPPFFALCTMTLLGQPKVDLSCVPLVKKGLNIMDLPILSSFVQSSIDAALAEYVAPKSLTLDLKDMLVGDDFKKDTRARGVLVVNIKRARDFKEGDISLGGLKKGSSDSYVAVGWAKFGKPLWSTRVIVADMEPNWDETTFILVSPEELNAGERLRVQLWDSDRTSADDDLGRIEVDLKKLMHNPQSNGTMWDRHDGFKAPEAGKEEPGWLNWSVGYFSKNRITEKQLQQQKAEPDVKTLEQLKEKVSKDAEKKMRETTNRDESREISQQKAQDLKAREDRMVVSAPPPHDYPTGIFSVQIHNIIGLEFEKTNKAEQEDGDDTEEGSNELPSSYCSVILNHQKIFKTRTKPKNSKPFFNAGTERLIRDWRTTEVMLSIRDSRVHEDDPLLGIVYLPLSRLFRERSQIMETYPLVGGIGYGRIRMSMVFRSVQLQLPRELLGWDFGTLEITGPIVSKDLATGLRGLRLKLRTSVNRGKMYTTDADGNDIHWTGRKGRPVRLGVRKRYCSCLVIEFRKNSMMLDKTPAFAILWLKDIPDDEEKILTVPVYHGKILERAEANCLDADDLGETMGSIDVPLKLWHGLGGYHQKLASKSPNLQDVLEALATANDNEEVRTAMSRDDDADSSDSDSSADESTTTNDRDENGVENKSIDNGKRGPLAQLRDYKEHSGELHRQHRGLMQWKGARTAKWMKTKVQHGREHLRDGLKLSGRDPGIETEV